MPGPGQADRPPVSSEFDPSVSGSLERGRSNPRSPSVPMMTGGRNQLGSNSSQGSDSQERASLNQGSDSQKSALVRPYAVDRKSVV